jgi:predicted  nucleic acid-binding Zn-ribbon protein
MFTSIIVMQMFFKAAKGLKKTRTRALSRAHKNIGNLKDEIETLRKRHKTKDKKIERLTKKIEHTKTTGPSELTPRKQTGEMY